MTDRNRGLGCNESSGITLVSYSIASAIRIVRPAESTADTQPHVHPALLRLAAMISKVHLTCSAVISGCLRLPEPWLSFGNRRTFF